MAGSTLKIKIESGGFEEWTRDLKADDLNRLEKSIGLEMAEIARDHIEEHKTPEGQQMKPWSEKYEKRVRDSGDRRDILMGPERRLHHSISYMITNEGIYYGSNMVYAAVHQWGWKEKNVPARPYLGMGPEEKQGIEDILEDFTVRLARV